MQARGSVRPVRLRTELLAIDGEGQLVNTKEPRLKGASKWEVPTRVGRWTIGTRA